ncbi:MAG: hypothetical protein K9L75_05575 [Spirochaetia bacterium]|nr:hypothetical protein [Spirochaetia bacterium]
MERNENNKALVKLFIDKVMYLKILYYMQEELFENNNTYVFEQTAPIFFNDLNSLLINNIILEIAKITDPGVDKTSKSNNSNLTFEYLIDTIDWDSETEKELTDLNKQFKAFRQYIKKARNKVIAHNDKNIYLSNVTLGAFPEGSEKEFFEKMEVFCDICYRNIFKEPLGEMYPGQNGDVIDLKKSLKKAIAFDKYIGTASLEEAGEIEEIFLKLDDA